MVLGYYSRALLYCNGSAKVRYYNSMFGGCGAAKELFQKLFVPHWYSCGGYLRSGRNDDASPPQLAGQACGPRRAEGALPLRDSPGR